MFLRLHVLVIGRFTPSELFVSFSFFVVICMRTPEVCQRTSGRPSREFTALKVQHSQSSCQSHTRNTHAAPRRVFYTPMLLICITWPVQKYIFFHPDATFLFLRNPGSFLSSQEECVFGFALQTRVASVWPAWPKLAGALKPSNKCASEMC